MSRAGAFSGKLLFILLTIACEAAVCGPKVNGAQAIDGSGIQAIDGSGIQAIDGSGIQAIDGSGIQAIDGSGIQAIDGSGIRTSGSLLGRLRQMFRLKSWE